jgi:site-specific DNA-methyltransferase (adenine-specific)
MNRLYFGDNLEWLRDRREFPDASVDLVYLDPPFNSNGLQRSLPRARRSSAADRTAISPTLTV